MSIYRRDPHELLATCLSRAATSMSAEWPSGKAPTARVLRRMDGNEGLVIEVYPLRREAQDGPITGVGVRFEEGQVS